MTTAVTNTDDVIDIRDVIEIVESDDSDNPEYPELIELLEDLKGNGGDEHYKGDWYPVTLIHESHFQDYAQELAEECGLIPNDLVWPCTCIDWKEAADQLRGDYSIVEFDGETYYYR